MSSALDRISLVIVTWHGDDVLRTCLRSLLAVYSKLPETIVVDNANQPSTRLLAEEFQGVKYIPCPDNRGFAGGNNAALPFCTKDYLLLLNNDTEFREDSISALVEFMDRHPRCGEAQGRTVLGCDPTIAEGCGMMLSGSGLLTYPHDGKKLEDVLHLKPFPVLGAGGMFLIVRRTALGRLGNKLFHDQFKSYYEDADLGIRLWLCGYEAWYCPTPPVVHHRNFTSKKLNQQSVWTQQKANIWMSMLIAYGWHGLLRYALLLFILQQGKALVHLLKGDVQPLRSNLFVIRFVLRNRRYIFSERQLLKKNRVLSDHAFFRKMRSLASSISN